MVLHFWLFVDLVFSIIQLFVFFYWDCMQSVPIIQPTSIVEDALGNTIHERFFEYLCRWISNLKMLSVALIKA